MAGFVPLLLLLLQAVSAGLRAEPRGAGSRGERAGRARAAPVPLAPGGGGTEGYRGTVGFCLQGPGGIGKWECQLYGDGGSQKVWVQRERSGEVGGGGGGDTIGMDTIGISRAAPHVLLAPSWALLPLFSPQEVMGRKQPQLCAPTSRTPHLQKLSQTFPSWLQTHCSM